jgi:hypothetical protein
VIHVGRAANIRARVRGYFSGNASSVVDLRAVPQLLRETAAIDHRVCAGALEAAVRELRLVERLRPRFNRRSGGRTPSYLKLTRGPTRRLRVVRSLRDSDDVALGPFRTPDAARFVRDAIAPLPPDVVRRGCDGEPEVVLDAVRDRAGWHAVAAALRTRQTVRTLRETPRLRFDSAEGLIEIRHGSLVLHDDDRSAPDDQELILVAQWLARPSSRARLLDVDGVCASALPGAPPYDAGRERSRGGRADVCSGSIE